MTEERYVWPIQCAITGRYVKVNYAGRIGYAPHITPIYSPFKTNVIIGSNPAIKSISFHHCSANASSWLDQESANKFIWLLVALKHYDPTTIKLVVGKRHILRQEPHWDLFPAPEPEE